MILFLEVHWKPDRTGTGTRWHKWHW